MGQQPRRIKWDTTFVERVDCYAAMKEFVGICNVANVVRYSLPVTAILQSTPIPNPDRVSLHPNSIA